MAGPYQVSFAAPGEGPPGARHIGSLVEPVEVTEHEPPTAPHQTLRKKTPAPKPAPQKPVDIVKLAKARLRDVKRELKRMTALEKERGELERLIAAAEGAPVRSSATGRVIGLAK